MSSISMAEGEMHNYWGFVVVLGDNDMRQVGGNGGARKYLAASGTHFSACILRAQLLNLTFVALVTPNLMRLCGTNLFRIVSFF